MSKLLLLSNSTNYGEDYLAWCDQTIADFIEDDKQSIVFVPFAVITVTSEEYTEKVNKALSKFGITVINLDKVTDKVAAVENASAIFIGGGNTFHLLNSLYEHKLMEAIRKAIDNGVKYVGWSAGSNVTCPNICTTNDMPITEPPSFNALQLVPFQINPHFTDKSIDGHGGESRQTRLTEFVNANPGARVVCLPEASYLEVVDNKITYFGSELGLTMDREGVIPIKKNQQL